MARLTSAYIRRLLAIESAACPAPWTRFIILPCVGVDTPDCTVIHTESSTGAIGPHTNSNHEFIVVLRNSVKQILTELLEYQEGDTD